MIKEFREFALRGSVLDMAVGIIIGAAFGAIVSSLVSDILMPPIGLLLGRVDFSNLYIVLAAGKVAGPYSSLAAAQQAGAVTFNYGVFINKIISFLIVALSLFLILRSMNRMKNKTAAVPLSRHPKNVRSALRISQSRRSAAQTVRQNCGCRESFALCSTLELEKCVQTGSMTSLADKEGSELRDRVLTRGCP